MTLNIKYKKLDPNAEEPVISTSGSAAFDLHALLDKDVDIYSRDTVKIPTGIAVAIPEGYFGAVFARSGLSCKYGIRPANCVGVVDSDYRGEVVVYLHNDNPQPTEPVTIRNGDRIAQMVIIPVPNCTLTEVSDLGNTERGANGFGSTGR